ncbi:MAG: hypothetical protein WCA77_04025 [Thermoplasmata archaeon]
MDDTPTPTRVRSTPYDAQRYRIPSWGWRITLGALRLVPLLLLFTAVPYVILQVLAAHGIHSPINFTSIAIVGVLVSVLSAAAYILKPTRAFGPVWMASCLVTAAYFLSFVPEASFSTGLPNGGLFTVSYGTILLLLAVVPGLRAVAAGLTTVEDLRRPSERLPWDFPP